MCRYVAVLSIIVLAASLNAGEYVIITNAKTPIEKVSKNQLRDIFLKKRHYVGEQKVIPVNISASMPIRIYFEEKILRMDREKLNGFWTKQHFQGVTPPSIQSSLQSVKLFVKNVNGSIGYIPKNLLDDDIKVVYEF